MIMIIYWRRCDWRRCCMSSCGRKGYPPTYFPELVLYCIPPKLIIFSYNYDDTKGVVTGADAAWAVTAAKVFLWSIIPELALYTTRAYTSTVPGLITYTSIRLHHQGGHYCIVGIQDSIPPRLKLYYYYNDYTEGVVIGTEATWAAAGAKAFLRFTSRN
jgi:hypothetical protein